MLILSSHLPLVLASGLLASRPISFDDPHNVCQLNTATASSKVQMVLDISNAVIVGSNPA
jgi:hypothetical protein